MEDSSRPGFLARHNPAPSLHTMGVELSVSHLGIEPPWVRVGNVAAAGRMGVLLPASVPQESGYIDGRHRAQTSRYSPPAVSWHSLPLLPEKSHDEGRHRLQEGFTSIVPRQRRVFLFESFLMA